MYVVQLLLSATGRNEALVLRGCDTIDNIRTLCAQSFISDDLYSSETIENVKRMQSQTLQKLNLLSEHIHNVQDRASVDHCRRICKEMIDEVERILPVAREVVSTTNSSEPPKSTVNELPV